MDSAIKNGDIRVLDEFLAANKKDGLPLVYTSNAIDLACSNGHVAVLDWFWDNGVELKYSSAAADWAASGGHIDVLEWFKTKPKKLTFTWTDIVAHACDEGHVEVLEWLRSNVPGVFDANNLKGEDVVDDASAKGHVNVLDWWLKQSDLPFSYTGLALSHAARSGHIDVLEWFASHGLELKSTPLNWDSDKDLKPEVLAWYERNRENIKFETDESAYTSGSPTRSESWVRVHEDAFGLHDKRTNKI